MSEREKIEVVRTDCLYPSFEQVEVTIFPHGEGFRVTDEGRAARAAWLHGREVEDVRSHIRDAALRYGVEVQDVTLYADAPTADWILSARLSVANASAQAANAAMTAPTPKEPEHG